MKSSPVRGQTSNGPRPAWITDAAVRCGLTRLEVATLRLLYRLQHDGGRLPCIRYAVLGDLLGAHHGSVRRAVRNLEALGLVERYMDRKRPWSRQGQIGQRPNKFRVLYKQVMTLARAATGRARPPRKAGAHSGAPNPQGPEPGVEKRCVEPPDPPPAAGPAAARAALALARAALKR